MDFKIRNHGASAPAAGQAQPLPVPREGEGRAAPLPTPREGDGRATPLPLAPRVGDAPDDDDPPSPKSPKTYSITKPALDYYCDRAKGHFARFNNMSVAFKLAGRDLKTRIVKNGRVFDLKPVGAIESFLESHTLRTRDGAPQEAPDVAARRRDWDEAKRSGDAGAMTTTANALMRAVEEARGHLEAHEASNAARHLTSEALNPSETAEGRETTTDSHARVLAQGPVTKWGNSIAAVPNSSSDNDVTTLSDSRNADADIPVGEVPHAPKDGVADHAISAKRAMIVADTSAGYNIPAKASGAARSLGAAASPIATARQQVALERDFYNVQPAPSRQRRYQTREQSWGEFLRDLRPHWLGGPRDDFGSTATQKFGSDDGRPPFDPQAGYNARARDRLNRAASGGLSGRPIKPAEGVDIDGVAYRSLLMVGSNRGDTNSQGLSAAGVDLLADILLDRVERYATPGDAADALIRAEEEATGKKMSAADRARLIEVLANTRGLMVPLPESTRKQAAADRTLVMVLVDSAFSSYSDAYRDSFVVPSVKAHEVGHVASRLLKLDERFEALTVSEREQVAAELEGLFRESLRSQGRAAADDWADSPEEWIAEVLMVYLMEPEFAKKKAPLTCSLLRKLWNEHPLLGQVVRLS